MQHVRGPADDRDDLCSVRIAPRRRPGEFAAENASQSADAALARSKPAPGAWYSAGQFRDKFAPGYAEHRGLLFLLQLDRNLIDLRGEDEVVLAQAADGMRR